MTTMGSVTFNGKPYSLTSSNGKVDFIASNKLAPPVLGNCTYSVGTHSINCGIIGTSQASSVSFPMARQTSSGYETDLPPGYNSLDDLFQTSTNPQPSSNEGDLVTVDGKPYLAQISNGNMTLTPGTTSPSQRYSLTCNYDAQNGNLICVFTEKQVKIPCQQNGEGFVCPLPDGVTSYAQLLNVNPVTAGTESFGSGVWVALLLIVLFIFLIFLFFRFRRSRS